MASSNPIENKIEQISQRIVRGKMAKNRTEVKLYLFYKYIVMLASVLTTLGVSNPISNILAETNNDLTLSGIFREYGNLPAWLLIVLLIVYALLLLMMTFYKQMKVEEKAMKSISLAGSFSRLEVSFHACLDQEDPMEQLNLLCNNAVAYEADGWDIIAAKDKCRNEIDTYIQNTIREHSKSWKITIPETERRERL